MYCMQSRFEKNCATLRKVCASAKSFAEELSRPPKPACALSSAGTRRGHFRTTDETCALYSAADVPRLTRNSARRQQFPRAIQRGERTKLTRYSARRRQNQSRYTARRTYQAHALYSAATAKPIALYSAANVASSRAIQRGDSKTNRAIQRGERTRLTRCSARRRQSQTRYTARRTHQAHPLSSAGTSTRRRRR